MMTVARAMARYWLVFSFLASEAAARKEIEYAAGFIRRGFVHSNITAIHYECTYIVPFNKEVYLHQRNRHKEKDK